MRVITALLVVCMAAALATGAWASNVSFGSTARSVALGGAGIALGDDSGTTTVLNPAAPAVHGAKFRMIWPGLGFHTSGASFGDLTDSISKISDGSNDSAIDLVNDFAKQKTTLTFNSVMGFAGPFGMTIEGEAQGIIDPGAAAKEWAGAARLFQDGNIDLVALQTVITNANFQTTYNDAVAFANTGNPVDLANAQASFGQYLTDLSQNFVDANVVYGPAVTLSRGYDTTAGRVFVGVNTKLLYSEAHRWQITAAADPGNPLNAALVGGSPVIDAGVLFNAVEQPVIKNTSLKMDIGTIYKPNDSIWQYGAVISNFMKPDFGGIANAQDGRMISVGVAALPIRGMTFAADLVNIFGANDENAQLRFGGEYKLGNFVAARAGYSGKRWTYGFGVFGINVAFTGKSAQFISNAIRF